LTAVPVNYKMVAFSPSSICSSLVGKGMPTVEGGLLTLFHNDFSHFHWYPCLPSMVFVIFCQKFRDSGVSVAYSGSCQFSAVSILY
jgi:hypothetical protein